MFSLDEFNIVLRSLMPYALTGREDDISSTCHVQCDPTVKLNKFKCLAIGTSCNVFVNQINNLLVIENNVMCTRFNDVLEKTLSARKAGRDGHIIDIITATF